PGRRHRNRWVVFRIDEWPGVGVPVAFPAKHAEARDSESRQRLAYEVGNKAKIFRDNLRARIDKDVQQPLAERDLIGFLGRREERRPAVAWTAVGAVETHEMIDAVAVIQIGAAPRSLAEPAKVVGRDHIPTVHGHAPVLTALAERIGRHSGGYVEKELILPG